VNSPDALIRHLEQVLSDGEGFIQAEAATAMGIIEELQIELAKCKPTDQTGPVSASVNGFAKDTNLFCAWSGPIPEPEEKP
jgi:hypothetical protein